MDEKIDIKAAIIKIISKWHYFIIAAVLILPLAYAYTHFATRIYHVQTSILLREEHSPDLTGKDFMKGMDLFTSHTVLEDEIGILRSYSMVEKTVRELDFGVSYFAEDAFRKEEKYGDSPFTIVLDSLTSQITEVPVFITKLSDDRYRIVASARNVDAYNFITGQAMEKYFKEVEIDTIVTIGHPFHSEYLGFTLRVDNPVEVKRNDQYFFVIHNLNSLVESYREKLTITPISRESNIVDVSLRAPVPHKAIRFLNTLLGVYLQNELNKKNQLGLRTIHFIDNQLNSVSDSLKRVEGSLENFRVKSNIQDVRATAESLSKSLEKLETEKAAIDIKLKYYTYIANSLNEGRLGDIVAPSTFGLEDALLNNLLIELSKLNQERAGLNYNAKEQNPLTEVVDLKIRNTKRTLVENVKNIIDVSTIAQNDLADRIDRIKRELNRLPRNERELVNIQRKFDFSDNVYNYLLEKRAEAGIAIASNTIEKTIVDKAKIIGDGPVSPNNRLIYLIAAVLCFGLPIAFILARDFWNDHILSQPDIERITTIPFLGSVIHGNRHERAALLSQKKTPLAESFQSLRVNLQYLTLGKEKNIVGFTSSMESEGKTFCAVNLAAAIALSGKKTALIDADMRRPSVSLYFSMENTKGLSNYLVGGCQLQEIIHATAIKGFHVITSGPVPPNPLNLIGLPQMDQLINYLKQTYDTIILDAPPMGYVAEYIILMKYTDANIYVVRSDYTSRYHLSRINKLYEDKKIDNVSIVLNDVKTNRLNGYSYGYGAAYQ